jgi:hypothetical protein
MPDKIFAPLLSYNVNDDELVSNVKDSPLLVSAVTLNVFPST